MEVMSRVIGMYTMLKWLSGRTILPSRSTLTSYTLQLIALTGRELVIQNTLHSVKSQNQIFKFYVLFCLL